MNKKRDWRITIEPDWFCGEEQKEQKLKHEPDEKYPPEYPGKSEVEGEDSQGEVYTTKPVK